MKVTITGKTVAFLPPSYKRSSPLSRVPPSSRIFGGTQRIEAYLTAKRALGMRFAIEERTLRLLDRFVAGKGLAVVEDVTPNVVDEFLASRPSRSVRSYNHLQGTVRYLLDWMSMRGIVGVVRYRGHSRREAGRRTPVPFTDQQVRQLLDAAARLSDWPGISSLAATTYRMTLAVLYCLGFASEKSPGFTRRRGLERPDACRAEHQVRQGSRGALRPSARVRA